MTKRADYIMAIDYLHAAVRHLLTCVSVEGSDGPAANALRDRLYEYKGQAVDCCEKALHCLGKPSLTDKGLSIIRQTKILLEDIEQAHIDAKKELQ
jgi:hypothetical protein